MRAATFNFALCVPIWLLFMVPAHGQTNNKETQSSASVLVADAKIEGLGSDSSETSARRILAHGPYGEGNFSGTRPVPPYTERLESRVGQLSVDWVAPKSIMVNQEVDFELVLRNRGPVAVQEIQVEPQLPESYKLVKADPAPRFIGKIPTWQIAGLEPQGEFRIKLRMILSSVGPSQTDARITYSTSTSTSFSVVEPKLQITADGPESAIVGNQVFFNVTVSNPGSGPTQNTVLRVIFPEGVQRVAEGTDYDIGSLNPGESRSIRVAGNMSQLGEHRFGFVATSDHGLRDEAVNRVIGLGAKMDLSIDGPTFRYVNRPANYTLRIKNSGTAAASEVYIRCAVPRPFAFLQAEGSGSFDAVNKNITWFIDHLAPGQEVEVMFRLQATTPGSVPILAEAVADRGLRVDAQHLTGVEGIAAILLEVVDVDDPVEVGMETFYEIIVTNQGTAFAEDVVVTAEVPEEMEITGSMGPSEGLIQGSKIQFGKLPKIAPRADAIYRVKVRGLQAKDVRIRVQVDAKSLDAPVLELESTKVYQD